jgi:hypothetical protein
MRACVRVRAGVCACLNARSRKPSGAETITQSPAWPESAKHRGMSWAQRRRREWMRVRRRHTDGCNAAPRAKSRNPSALTACICACAACTHGRNGPMRRLVVPRRKLRFARRNEGRCGCRAAQRVDGDREARGRPDRTVVTTLAGIARKSRHAGGRVRVEMPAAGRPSLRRGIPARATSPHLRRSLRRPRHRSP